MMPRLPRWRGWPLLTNAIRVEEFAENGSYVVRAELPGADPERDIAVMVADGELTIDLDRREPFLRLYDSEFRYGTARRHVVLPRAAMDETAVATYDDGILEVRVELRRSVPIGRTLPIRARRT